MSNVIGFPTRSYFEISGGIVSASPDPANIGQQVFHVSLIEAGQQETVFWDGASHAAAKRAASELAADFGIPVRDRFDENGVAS